MEDAKRAEEQQDTGAQQKDQQEQPDQFDQQAQQQETEPAEEPEEATTEHDEPPMLAAFDLYRELRLSTSGFNGDRARASYHRLSYRLHPRFGSHPSEAGLQRLTLAYAVLKDEARRAIYDTHGFQGVVESEKYMDPSAFEADAYTFYDDFYSGKDPADKEYFFLNGASIAANDSDHEGDDDDERKRAGAGEEEEDKDAAAVEEEADEEENLARIAAEAGASAIEASAKAALEAKTMPKPPVGLAASLDMSLLRPSPPDVFAEIRKRFMADHDATQDSKRPKVAQEEEQEQEQKQEQGQGQEQEGENGV